MLANSENSSVASDWKGSVFIPFPKKDNAKEWSNYPTNTLISHINKVMLESCFCCFCLFMCVRVYVCFN